jgi:hypothetical protein
MPVKVVVKGKNPAPEPGTGSQKKIPAIKPKEKKGNFYILTLIKKMFRIMLMDIRIRVNPELRQKYEDYSRFAELARRER